MTHEHPEHILVVGGGHAAGQLVAALRGGGFEGALTLVGEEPNLPYQRPPLSKTYLAGDLDGERLLVRPADFYEKNAVDTRLGCRAARLDREAREVELEGGERLPWARLALTTGTRVRRLPVEGTDLDGVHYLRSIADVDRIRERLERSERVVIIGGGFIGLEVAAVVRKLGKAVTVLEAQDRLMPRVVSPVVSEFYRRAHTAAGVEVVTGAQVAAIAGRGGRVASVACADGSGFEADMVIIGIGVIPNVELAEAAGLACDDGILVDELARTSDPRIVAAGDCTNHPNPLLGRRLRLESVQNALDQAKVAAATLLGNGQPYAQIPWFWSDQYDYKLQMVGLSTGYDADVVRGDLDQGKFSVFYFDDGALIAIDSVNRPADHMAGRRLLAGGIGLTPEQAADPEFELKSLLQGGGRG